MRIVISGYYGFGNGGDEAVLAGMVAALRARIPQAQLVVLSGAPAQTHLLHGVTGVSRLGGALPAVAGADLFLSGGGSLIQDATSARSALYYLGLLGLATVLSRATMVYAQGIGPLRRWWLRKLARWILRRVTVITVRDEESARLLRDLDVARPVQVVSDPAFALEARSPEDVQPLLGTRNGPRLGVALRPWGDGFHVQPLLDGLQAACQEIGAQVVALAFHPDRDLAPSVEAARVTNGRVLAGLPPSEMMAVVRSLDLMVGMRLHALIFAVAGGVPPVGLSYDPKVEGLFQRIGVTPLPPLSSLRAEDVRDGIRAAWDHRHATQGRLRAQAAALRNEALRAADVAASVLTMDGFGRGGPLDSDGQRAKEAAGGIPRGRTK